MDDKILDLLYAGEWVSGEAVSNVLGVSRAAVAKHINGLRELGYSIDAAPKRGYRLNGAPDVLSSYEIRRRLQGSAPWSIEVFDELDSTNAYLRRLGDSCPEYRVAIAHRQTAGRGRLDRSWYSPSQGGLWLSLLLRPTLPPDQAQLLTLTAAVSTAQAIRETGLPCFIKWPNDILTPDRRKLVGIRCEMRADLESVDWLVMGIGINVNNRDFPPELADKAACLRDLNQDQPLCRAALAATLLDRLALNYEQLRQDGFEPIRQQWTSMALALNEQACISGMQGREYGVVRGLDREGYLLLEQDGEIKRVLAGDMVISD